MLLAEENSPPCVLYRPPAQSHDGILKRERSSYRKKARGNRGHGDFSEGNVRGRVMHVGVKKSSVSWMTRTGTDSGKRTEFGNRRGRCPTGRNPPPLYINLCSQTYVGTMLISLRLDFSFYTILWK